MYENVRSNRIPLAREELKRVAEGCQENGQLRLAARIEAIVDGLMYRLPPAKPRAQTKQRRITQRLVLDVLAAHHADPTRHVREIGAEFDIDGGRVSEIINGHRTPSNPSGK